MWWNCFKHAIWDNATDNGAEICEGSNYSLRGAKKTFFEGGVRANAYASGRLLPDSMRGKTTNGFIHVTLLTGIPPSAS